jgi:radical SAM superfamily enzyme YgiQ (UPF0313 family)
MGIDILFINPAAQKVTYQGLSAEYTAVAPPVWTLLMAEKLRRSGFTVAVHDVNTLGWDDAEASELLRSTSPRCAVMMVYGHHPSASTQTMPAASRIAADIKRLAPDLPLAMGGTHPSALPERTLREEAADFVIMGTSPTVIEGFALVARGTKNAKDVAGLAYIDPSGSAVISPPPLLPAVLDDELPGYAWDLVGGLDNYRAHNMHSFQDFRKSARPDFADVRSPYAAISTSLGCPYNCDYCCINAIFGKPGIKYWSLEKVLSWLDELVVKYGVRNIRFDDELFILDPRRVERFCDMVIERGYDLNIWVYGRVDTVRPGLLEKLKKAGVNWICLGIESGNDEVRRSVNKKIGADIETTVREIQSRGIYVLGNYMFGLPDDDMRTMNDTLDMAIKLNCEYSNFYTVMPYPGSKLYLEAEANHTLPPSWGAYSQHGYETTPLPTKHLSPREVLKFRDEAFVKYHGRPEYLAFIEQRFGPETRAHIERMLGIKVKRRILLL